MAINNKSNTILTRPRRDKSNDQILSTYNTSTTSTELTSRTWHINKTIKKCEINQIIKCKNNCGDLRNCYQQSHKAITH